MCSFIISSRNGGFAATRVVLVDIDLVAGNLFDLVVIMMQAIVYGRVVGTELVLVVVKNARNVLGIVVLIRVLLRAIAVGRIRDTHAETAMLKVTQVLVVTSLRRRTLGKSRRARVRCVERLFWILDWRVDIRIGSELVSFLLQLLLNGDSVKIV